MTSNKPQRTRLLAAVRDGWCIVGLTLLIFLGLETGIRLYRRLPSFKSPSPVASVPSVIDENRAVGTSQWQPYVYWRIKPFKGFYFNIDEEGIRRTENSSMGFSKPTRIFVFGGSTVWGSEVADRDTIPSLLAKELETKGIKNIELTNFGQPGYVSTQELLTLWLETINRA